MVFKLKQKWNRLIEIGEKKKKKCLEYGRKVEKINGKGGLVGG
jgi:hypothetical protein